MKEETKQNLKNKNTWVRLFFMVLFVIILVIVRIVTSAVIFFQVVVALLTGGTNSQVLRLGNSLSKYIYQILLYLTFNTETKPFPFSEWPTVENTKIEGDK